MFKRYPFFLAAICIFYCSPLYAANITQTVIEIRGEVLGVTCSVKEENLVVDLGETTNKDLFFHKRARNHQNFEIEFECAPGEEYTIDFTFTGTSSQDVDLQGTVQVLGTSDPTITQPLTPWRVGVQLAAGFDEQYLFSINNEFGELNYKIQDGSKIPFSAYLRLSSLVPTVDQVPTGYYEATANFLVEYE